MKKRVIYIYTDGKDYKIGKSDRFAETAEEAALERISEQSTAAVHGDLEILDELTISRENVDSLFIESYIHNKLEDLGYERLRRRITKEGRVLRDGNTEWFNLRDLNKNQAKSLIRGIFAEVNYESGQKSFEYYVLSWGKYYSGMVNTTGVYPKGSKKEGEPFSKAIGINVKTENKRSELEEFLRTFRKDHIREIEKSSITTSNTFELHQFKKWIKEALY